MNVCMVFIGGSSGIFTGTFDNTVRLFTDFLKRKGHTKSKNIIRTKTFEDIKILLISCIMLF